jgi:hypothetical protein
MLYDSMWDDFNRGKSNFPPLFVSLPQLRGTTDIVNTCLERWGLLKELHDQRFVLILDSFDEMKAPAHLCQDNGNFTRWADHVLVTGRTEAMPDNFLENYFLSRDGKSYEVEQRSVSPFSEEQVEYI